MTPPLIGAVARLYLAACTHSQTGQVYEPASPTLLLINDGSQVGLMPHDDVLRVHGSVRRWTARAVSTTTTARCRRRDGDVSLGFIRPPMRLLRHGKRHPPRMT